MRGLPSAVSMVSGASLLVMSCVPSSLIPTPEFVRLAAQLRPRIQGPAPSTADGRTVCLHDASERLLAETPDSGDLTEIPLPESARLVVTGGLQACALTVSGAIYCWGSLSPGPASMVDCSPHHIALPSPAVSVAVGSFWACASLEDGSLNCWDRIDDSSSGARYSLTDLGEAPPLVRMAASAATFCGISAVGELWCWGQLVIRRVRRAPSGYASPRPIRADISLASSFEEGSSLLAVSRQAICATGGDGFRCLDIEADVTTWGQGWDERGQFRASDAFTPIAHGPPIAACMVRQRLCELSSLGTVVCSDGELFSMPAGGYPVAAIGCYKDVLCIAGSDNVDCAFIDPDNNVAARFRIRGSYTSIAFSDAGFCGIASGGRVLCGGAFAPDSEHAAP